jgi:hypothetical protein
VFDQRAHILIGASRQTRSPRASYSLT